jgi:ADP-heptose:LPS heptosyltransferase
MRIVEVVRNFSKNGTDFRAGHRYVMAEDAENQWRNVAGDHFGMSYPVDSAYRPYKGQDLTGKKLMCWRTGGIGDMFFLIPVLRFLKKRFPGCVLKVASGCKQPLENLPEIDELVAMPFDAALLEDADFHLMFQGIIEGETEESKRVHAADMFFKYFSIDSTGLPDEEKCPQLYFTEGELDWCTRTVAKMGIADNDYVVGIQMETSAPLRNFPKDKMKIIIDVLAKEPNIKVVLIGSAQQAHLATFFKGKYPNVIPACTYNVRESIVLANRYDIMVSPDTFMVQTAGALGKPLVGLYGPFPSEVRMKYFKNAIGIDSSVVCSPCYKHDFRGCIKGTPSPCFSLIKPEDVLQAIDFLKYKFTGRHFDFMGHFLEEPDLSDIERFFLSADKGLCFFPGYFKHHNMIRVDPNKFVGADIDDLSTEFKRESFPFVLFMNDFSPKGTQVYQGCKSMVRPGGYFAVYRKGAQEADVDTLQKDIGKNFSLVFSKFDPTLQTLMLVGKKRY